MNLNKITLFFENARVFVRCAFYIILALFLRREFVLLFVKPALPIPMALKLFAFLQTSYIWTILPLFITIVYFIFNKNRLVCQFYEFSYQLIKLCNLIIIYSYLHIRLSIFGSF